MRANMTSSSFAISSSFALPYGAKTLTGASWTVTPGTPSDAAYALQAFSFTGVPSVATIYGYFVKSGTTLLWAERLAAPPFTVTAAGDVVNVTPKLTLGSNLGD